MICYKKDNILISVIIPAYNAANTIIRCIESVYSQTYDEIEIIIVNDGSTDNTVKIVQHFKKEHKKENLYIYTQENGGPSKARNNGIRFASGDWVAFLDADDCWLPDKLERQIIFSKENPEFSLIGTEYCDNKANANDSYREIKLSDLLFKNYVFTSSVIIKREIMNKFYFNENQRYSEDYRLWLQVSQYYKIAVLNTKLVIYAINENEFKNRLSSNLWKMEKSELANYFFLFKQKNISFHLCICAIIFSIFKYIKRIVINFS
jgi:glycosyltransferase involved in cell wall biosynthesis